MPTIGDVFRGLVGRPVSVERAVPINTFVVDSREASQGDCFVAVPGENTDGHLYIGEALQHGVHAVIAERDRTPADVLDAVTVIDIDADTDEPETLDPPLIFLSDDSLHAVQELAAWWRRRATPNMRVIGVTGSIGKTTVKEFTAAVLGQRFRTFKSEGNYNSDIGLPLTLLDMPLDAERAVLEMAMTRPGEIARLAEIAIPVIGVVTNVGPVHMARLGSMEAIADAKSELIQALPADGVAVLNADDDLVSEMAGYAAGHVFTYGVDQQATLWASDIESHGLDGISFRFHYEDDTVFARLPLLGRHSVHGALAAAAVGLVEGQSWGEIIAGLKDLSEMELLRIIVVSGVNDSTILDDTYNASPASVLAALNLLDDLPGRRVAVLGDMLELGEYEEEGHKRVARRAAEVANLLVTVGELGEIIAEEAIASGMPADTVIAMSTRDDAIDFLREHLQPDDMVLVKASRGLRLDEIVSALSVDDE